MPDLTRRLFLSQSACLAMGGLWPARAFAGPMNPAIAGKDPAMLALSVKPLILETPLDLLDKDSITHKSRLFVRNNQDWPEALTLDPKPLEGWTIELTGQLSQAVTLDVGDLARLDRESVEMVLQCSGSGRSLFSRAAKTEGTQWGRGGVGNVVFRGVPARAAFEHFGVKPLAEARFVTANGRDEPPPGKDDFEHSLPLDEVLKRSLFAFEMNGEPLPALHGGPVRLVTPGYFGTMHVKWLSQMRFEAQETRVSHQLPRYRVPIEPIVAGSEYQFTFENSRPNYRMNVKSTVLSPLAEARVKAGETVIRGIAFNDGQSAIATVLVSTDQGQTWRPAQLKASKDPYAWTRWEATAYFKAGHHEIWAMATDRLGRSQPLDGSVFWNPHGYEWNGVDKVPIDVVA